MGNVRGGHYVGRRNAPPLAARLLPLLRIRRTVFLFGPREDPVFRGSLGRPDGGDFVTRKLILAACAVGAQLVSSAAHAWFFFFIPTGAIQKAMETDPDTISVSAADRTIGQCAGYHLNQAHKGMTPPVSRSLDGTGGGMIQQEPKQTPESKYHSDMADVALQKALDKDKVKQLGEAYSVRWSRVASAGDIQVNRQYGVTLASGCRSADIPVLYSEYSGWQSRQEDVKRRQAEEERNRIATMQPTTVATPTIASPSQLTDPTRNVEGSSAAPERDQQEVASQRRGSGPGTTPVTSQALIVFVRARTGTALIDAGRSVILELKEQDSEPQMVGIGGGGTKIAYRTDTGQHTFAVIGENTEFLIANVLPDTTYYVSIDYQPGNRRNRYKLRPIDVREQNSSEFLNVVARAKSVENDPESTRWLSANMPSVKRRLQDNYGPWLRKPDSEKVVLGTNVSGPTQGSVTSDRKSGIAQIGSNSNNGANSFAPKGAAPAPSQITSATFTSSPLIASAESSVIANPKDARAWRALGEAHASNGDWARAEKAYEESLSLSPNDPQTLMGLASTYCKRYDREHLNLVVEENKRKNQALAEQIIRRCILP